MYGPPSYSQGSTPGGILGPARFRAGPQIFFFLAVLLFLAVF
jgi:hypothetical protein